MKTLIAAAAALAAVPTSASAAAEVIFGISGEATGTIQYDSYCYGQDPGLCGKTLPYAEKFDFGLLLYDFPGIKIGSSYDFRKSIGMNAAAYNVKGTIIRTGEASYIGRNFSSSKYDYDCCTRLLSASVFKVSLSYMSGGDDDDPSIPGTGDGDSGSHPESAVPEPATWLTMILGFGLVGYAMRSRRVRFTTG